MTGLQLKKIKKEAINTSENLFIEHNISDVRTKRLVNEYYYDKIYERELLKELKSSQD